jgi:hypothetical protein
MKEEDSSFETTKFSANTTHPINENSPSDQSESVEAQSDEDLFRLFAGPNADKFIKSYRAQVTKEYAFSLNWPVFFVPLPWLFYRKMFLIGILILMVPIILVTVFPALSGVSTAGMVGGLAVSANSIYVWAAIRKIEKIKIQNLVPIERDARIRTIGGTSKTGAAFGALIIAAIFALPFLNLAANELPECASATVQDNAGQFISDAFKKKGLKTSEIKFGDFRQIGPEDTDESRLCRFRAKFQGVEKEMFLGITWKSKTDGKYLIRIGPTQAAVTQ